MAGRVVARLFSARPYSACVCDREGAVCDCGDAARLVRMGLHFDQGEEAAPSKVLVVVKQSGVLFKTSTAGCRSIHSQAETQTPSVRSFTRLQKLRTLLLKS